MPRTLLVLACLLLGPAASFAPLDPQSLREQLNSPEFAKVLNEVLAAVHPGNVPQIDTRDGTHFPGDIPAIFVGISPSQKFQLPAAFCTIQEMFYACEWETKTNKYSVAVLRDDLSSAVAAALPNTWKREKGQDYAKIYTDFTDRTGQIVISVSCPSSNGAFPLPSFTAKLTIHNAALPGLR
jgi:hypothetical protein